MKQMWRREGVTRVTPRHTIFEVLAKAVLKERATAVFPCRSATSRAVNPRSSFALKVGTPSEKNLSYMQTDATRWTLQC
jgi:hypothetical protein